MRNIPIYYRYHLVRVYRIHTKAFFQAQNVGMILDRTYRICEIDYVSKSETLSKIIKCSFYYTATPQMFFFVPHMPIYVIPGRFPNGRLKCVRVYVCACVRVCVRVCVCVC